jgi:hypothetical protein
MKSFSVKPLILCVQVVISTFPQARKRSGWLAYAVYELEGFAKVGKREGLRKVVFFDDVPSVHLLFEGGKLLTLKRWDAATTWDTGFGC